ncbi:MAG: PD-(D/E)XK nuclease family protein [Caulobacterales bacterium]
MGGGELLKEASIGAGTARAGRQILRRTVVAHGRYATRIARLEAARQDASGAQVMTFEQLVARLAGGFSCGIEPEALKTALQSALRETALGELDAIKDLPGMVSAAAETLRKLWRADLDLTAITPHPRLEAMIRLERAVLDRLPAGMLRPRDLAERAKGRLRHASAVLGDVEILAINELSPCWRELLEALADYTRVTWVAGPRAVPTWLTSDRIDVVRGSPERPDVSAASAATTLHEAIEALRWVRAKLAEGVAAHDIAIAAATTADYDDHFLALRADAHFDVHFAHGVTISSTRAGQAAAAMADVLLRGLSQSRLRRLADLWTIDDAWRTPLPNGWPRVLPEDAPLTSLEAWGKVIDRLSPSDWPDGVDHADTLRAIVALLAKGPDAAEEASARLLAGEALAIWTAAVRAGPVGALEASLERLRRSDDCEPATSVAWMPASVLAAAPRRYVRLIGLNAARWPRTAMEDRLIPDHVIPAKTLDPLPIAHADRRDFETILATTEKEVVQSWARHDADGRELGRSPLLRLDVAEVRARRTSIPAHAFSETDRLTARPEDFANELQARSATSCWKNWRSAEITAHDGRVRSGHPALAAALNRTQSASSLQLLLRHPLGFVWKYALGLSAPKTRTEAITLDHLEMGNLVHAVLERAVRALEAEGGLAGATTERLSTAVSAAAAAVADDWAAEHIVPPGLIWGRTLEDARQLAGAALSSHDARLTDARSFAEVPFGGKTTSSAGPWPWDPESIIEIPSVGIRIAGSIDRLDIAPDGSAAFVCDYKTGRSPSGDLVLKGGGELQRCLYAFAVKTLIGSGVAIDAALFYLRDKRVIRLADPEATLIELMGYLTAMRQAVLDGHAPIGPDAAIAFDEFAFALPANAMAVYRPRKAHAATALLGDAALVWEAP